MILTITAATAAQVFTYIGYVIVALLALMVMIVVHELGHYVAGKLLVTSFSLARSVTNRRADGGLPILLPQ